MSNIIPDIQKTEGKHDTYNDFQAIIRIIELPRCGTRKTKALKNKTPKQTKRRTKQNKEEKKDTPHPTTSKKQCTGCHGVTKINVK